MRGLGRDSAQEGEDRRHQEGYERSRPLSEVTVGRWEDRHSQSQSSLYGGTPASIEDSLRESSKLDKTKLPGDTYEKWLGTQTKQPGKVRRSETPAPDSYETWIGKRVETKQKAINKT